MLGQGSHREILEIISDLDPDLGIFFRRIIFFNFALVTQERYAGSAALAEPCCLSVLVSDVVLFLPVKIHSIAQTTAQVFIHNIHVILPTFAEIMHD